MNLDVLLFVAAIKPKVSLIDQSPKLKAKPRVSLTVPNCNQFVQVSLTILDAIAKAKKLICKSMAQNLKQDLLTKRLFSFGKLPKLNNLNALILFPICDFSCKLDPGPKVA